jgi:ABC-type multidrug transport system fused ATPase/permease subunit
MLGIPIDLAKLQLLMEQFEHILQLAESPDSMPQNADGEVILKDCDFSWPVQHDGKLSSTKTLTAINLHLEPGELVVVSGRIGSGKTSLLLSLLGETECDRGAIEIPSGCVAYQPQNIRLMSGTIRENILFGEEESSVDNADLQTALIASQLAVDMDDERSTLSHLREYTQVGEKGGDLSGGQKARTALARAVYACLKGSKLVLLDDPLAAVDNQLVTASWNAAVRKAMSTATRIVVLNSQLVHRLAPDADRLIILDEGRVMYNGPPGELGANHELLQKLGHGYELAEVHEKKHKPMSPCHLKSVGKMILWSNSTASAQSATREGEEMPQV